MRKNPCLLSAVLAFPVSGCGPEAPVLSQAAITTIVVDRDVGSLTACSYAKLEASQGRGIKKVDLQNAVLLALESGAVRIWELTFTPETDARTQVDYSAVQTLWGPQTTSTHQIMSDVRSCSGRSSAKIQNG
jgi:hypothetical protein